MQILWVSGPTSRVVTVSITARTIGLGLAGLRQTHIELQQFAVLIGVGGRCLPPTGEMTGWLVAVFG